MIAENTVWFKKEVKKVKGYATKEMREQLKYEMQQRNQKAYRKAKRKKGCGK